ncbi:gamma carbonic anhydrase family protein [Prosthecomicrobium sp. N25]|uniref:gamma carbonic anhydrase family protein n=1 Tax=Prosthecomicrobium sp. N25 TaxID=3129254 RepID=UPI0030789367
MPLYELDGVRPDLPPRGQYYVAPDAVLIGKVRLLPGASVWFGAVLRGDNEWIEIGPESNIQDLACLHTDPGFPLTVGRGVTVGHCAILHGCKVGDDSLIGMGATLLNGSSVAAESIVGANALVTEGKSFPARSLVVGAPGKAVRSLDDGAIEAVRRAAVVYSDRARLYAGRLKEIQPD